MANNINVNKVVINMFPLPDEAVSLEGTGSRSVGEIIKYQTLTQSAACGYRRVDEFRHSLSMAKELLVQLKLTALG